MTQTRPNILLVLVDDMGYGDLGAFGNPEVVTPHLDALAAEAIRLRQQYSAAPVCAPARAGLLTGRYPQRTGVIDTLESRKLDRLALDEVTLADIAQQGGYATGLFGKWHLGAFDPRYHPRRRGFDEFVGFRGGWSDYWDYRLDCNGTSHASDGTYLTEVITDAACDFIRRHSDEPFFAHVTYNAPHFPQQAPEQEVARFRDTGKFTEAVSTIYAQNKCMDDGMGRLLATLEAQGVADNTLVIFASDNGPQLNGDSARFNGPLSGAKCQVQEGGIRTPALVRWRDGLPGNRDEDAMFTFLDYLPTVAAACGLPLPDRPLDGMNLLPLLQGARKEQPDYRCWQWTRYQPHPHLNAAIRMGAWKLVRGAIPNPCSLDPADGELDRRIKRDPHPETLVLAPDAPHAAPAYGEPLPTMLFNLDDDPGEQQDLVAQEPARARRMESLLDAWYEEVEADRNRITEREDRMSRVV